MTAKEFTIEVWREASQDLGFAFTAPFTLTDGNDTLDYMGLVASFGSDLGTLIIEGESSPERDRLMRVALECGYGYSCMSMSYQPYNREVTIDVLNDWSWCGSPEKVPFWYTQPSEEDEND
ncbi:MAG: hypothetical protein ABIP71_09680 [Verrucomicrobiota bacterium]